MRSASRARVVMAELIHSGCTHLAEELFEEKYCLEIYGMRPVEFVESVGWLGDDVWFAHSIFMSSEEIDRFAETGTGVAHCPSANGLRAGHRGDPCRPPKGDEEDMQPVKEQRDDHRS